MRLALALLLSISQITGGQVYRKLVEAGGARVAVWRYPAAGERLGPPVLLIPELGFDKRLFDLEGEGLARTLQAAGREVFVLEWRGSGASSPSIAGLGGLDALFEGDAHAAVRIAREASRDGRVQLVGVGLGGAAAYLLAAEPEAKIAAVVAIGVPAAFEVPNEAVRKLIAEVRARSERPAGAIDLQSWSRLPAPVGDGKRDLFELLFLHGNAFSAGRAETLRAALGKAAPELLEDVARWMELGELPRGPSLQKALANLELPLLVITGLRDDLVHPEHALAVRELAPKALRDELVVQRLEGFPEDAGHLLLQASGATHLHQRIAEWLASHF